MELELLEKKIRRLVCKLKKYNIDVEVFDHNDIVYGPVLGKGGEGIVQKCTVLYNSFPVDAAAKTVTSDSDDTINLTLEEIELLCLARDPIITTTLQVYGVAAVPQKDHSNFGHLVIIMEAGLMNALQLYQTEEIPLSVTYDLWSRLAGALHCIHTKKIIHQDLKPENVLITGIRRNSHGEVEKIDFKVIDLGMGRRVVNDRIVTDDILGTNGYHAPEVLFDDSYDFRADIFMLGVTFCVMLMPATQLEKSVLDDLLKRIHEAKQKKILGKNLFNSVIEPALSTSQPFTLSTDIRTMICKMLERVERRDITLLNIGLMCRREALQVKRRQSQLPPVLTSYVELQYLELSDGKGNEVYKRALSSKARYDEAAKRTEDVADETTHYLRDATARINSVPPSNISRKSNKRKSSVGTHRSPAAKKSRRVSTDVAYVKLDLPDVHPVRVRSSSSVSVHFL